MKDKITTVIFDYGCVLSNPQDESVFKKMYSLVTDSDFSVFEYIYYRYRADYDQGLVSGREYWKKILDEFGTTYSDELADSLIDLDTACWTSLNSEMREFVEELKDRKYRTAVLSNMPAEILEYLNSETDIFTLFDKTVFSCDLKLIKPDPEIYIKTLNMIGCTGSEAVFIDDRKDNIEAAEMEGIRGICYSGFSSFRKEIDKILDL